MTTPELRAQATAACARWKREHRGTPEAELAAPAMFLDGTTVIDEPSPEHLAKAREVAALLSLLIRHVRGSDD